MLDQKFKTTDSLFARILEDFSSFAAAQLIDEGTFHKHVAFIIKTLGVEWYRQAEETLEVCDYKCDLPGDFRLLESAYKCDMTLVDSDFTDGIVMEKLLFDHYPFTADKDPHTFNSCDPWQPKSNYIFNRHELTLVKRGEHLYKCANPILLKLGNVNTRRNHCTSDCANVFSRSHETITVQNGKIYTNFKSGHIYLTYNAFPLDELTGLPLIPDNEIIEKCIEDYIKYNLIKILWTNSSADVDRKVALYKQDYQESLLAAVKETKLPSFQTMLNQVRLQRKSLNVYQLSPAR